jgi:hypothetical protein
MGHGPSEVQIQDQLTSADAATGARARRGRCAPLPLRGPGAEHPAGSGSRSDQGRLGVTPQRSRARQGRTSCDLPARLTAHRHAPASSITCRQCPANAMPPGATQKTHCCSFAWSAYGRQPTGARRSSVPLSPPARAQTCPAGEAMPHLCHPLFVSQGRGSWSYVPIAHRRTTRVRAATAVARAV